MVPIFYVQKKHQTSEEDSLRIEAYILMTSLFLGCTWNRAEYTIWGSFYQPSTLIPPTSLTSTSNKPKFFFIPGFNILLILAALITLRFWCKKKWNCYPWLYFLYIEIHWEDLIDKLILEFVYTIINSRLFVGYSEKGVTSNEPKWWWNI